MTLKEFLERFEIDYVLRTPKEIENYVVLFQNSNDDKVIESYENVNIETVIIEDATKRIFLI